MAHFSAQKCVDFSEVFILKGSVLWFILRYHMGYKLFLAWLIFVELI